MKKIFAGIIAVVLVGAVWAVVLAAEGGKGYYVCNCMDDCTCNTISREPGKCKCGSDLMGMHLLAIEKDTAVFCRCGTECTCERSKDDPDKCGCGKPVKKVSLKGKYVCACGADCACNSISDSPGKCACGKDMRQVI